MTGLDFQDDKSYTLCEDDESDYEVIHDPSKTATKLVVRQKACDEQPEVSVELLSTTQSDGVVVSIKPPRVSLRPNGCIHHVPCDIVLAIDISGSMSAEAPPPVENPDDAERNGLTVLDLVKHAARTILETLDDTDRLAIVTFSTEATLVQPLLPMTLENKAIAAANIDALQPDSMTNLWHGILESIKAFDGDERSNCVPAIMVLTDGLPNHMCPNQGYVRKIRSYKLPASLHTFGFGFSLRSGLLKSIAEVGGGNYAFIPDAGMLGTVFIHAVANLQSTFATNVQLTLTMPNQYALVETMGSSVHRFADSGNGPVDAEMDASRYPFSSRVHGKHIGRKERPETAALVVHIGSLQYGQSRDIVLKFSHKASGSHTKTMQCKLTGRPVDGTILDNVVDRTVEIARARTMDIAYHELRADICALLGSFFPLNSLEERQVTSEISLEECCTRVEALAGSMNEDHRHDVAMRSLWDDLVGPQPSGQIRLALSSAAYFERWGKHYLLSILNAHQQQICNSFKDNGPLQYGKDSPLFVKCRDDLDRAFDHLPPPVPSKAPRVRTSKAKSAKVDMRRYHRRDNPCFAEHALVKLHDHSSIEVRHLRPGMRVQTVDGTSSVVAAVVATKVFNTRLRVVGNLAITAWHPVYLGGRWTFPELESSRTELYTGSIYSVMLEWSELPSMHTIEVSGCWAVTLGHGVVDGIYDVRSHKFFGNYEAVQESLELLPMDSQEVLHSTGVRRDVETGLACGFQPAQHSAGLCV